MKTGYILTIGFGLACHVLQAEDVTCDLVIYGSSPAAVTAAVKATDMGLKSIIVAPAQHIGGLSVSGLGFTDSGNTSAIGGLARDFYRRIYKAYQKPEAWTWQMKEDFKAGGQGTRAMNHEEGTMWTFEPHIAEQVFIDWLAEHKVDVRRGEFLDREKGVSRKDGRIVSVTTLSGNTYTAGYFIDATYEGDLLAAAGVPYRVGREACSEFGEKWNGNQVGVLHHKHHFRDWGISPYKVPGDPSSGLCAEVDPGEPGVKGAGDKRVQAYCYRLCLTDDPRNRIPFAKPDGYDPARYELLARCYQKGYKETFQKFDRIANHKTDTNNHGPLNFDWLGGSYEWPEAGYERRAELAKAHKDYQMGVLYFIANDPSVPKNVRDAMSRWGLAKDEFVENGGWPYEIYVREGRRMVGAYTMTEHDCLGEPRHPAQGTAYGPVGMGSYSLDSHNVRRYVTSDGFVQNEGDIGVHPKGPYGIDYGAIVPRKGDCDNLLVPVALSATHTAFGSIRMEPVFMLLGEAAATAAAIAVKDGRCVQDVTYRDLAARLRADGQVLDTELDVLADRMAAAEVTGSAFDIADTVRFTASERRADALVRQQRPDGSWEAVDYSSSSLSAWQAAVGHLRERVTFLAQMYRKTGRADYAQAAKKGLDGWMAKRLENPNWWWNEIGAPQSFGVAAILVRDALTPADRARYADYLDVSQIKLTGQNRVWLARIVLMRALLRGDRTLADRAAAVLAEEVCVSDGPEGIASDWSFRQHGPQMQFGNYGASYLLNMARLANVFATTRWAFPEEKLDILYNLGEQGFRWTLWNGNMDFLALGRQIVPDAQRRKAEGIARALVEFEQSGRRFAAASPTGLRFFPQSAYAVYRPGAWMASVKMNTREVFETETWINSENTLGGHLADGALFVYATGREYENIAPLWGNWRLVPGVTTYLALPPARRSWPIETGANELSEMSATSNRVDFALRRDGLEVRKRWDFAPSGVRCTGTVLAATNAASRVVTCVEHALAADNVKIGAYDEAKGALCVENGYFVYEIRAPKAAIHASVEERIGDWQGISPASVGHPVKGRVLCIYIDHGISPQGATYDYTISPEKFDVDLPVFAAPQG